MKLSIVTGTLNRLPYLKRFIASIAPSCGGIEHEIIIVDGGSTDGTLEWLRTQSVVLIEQGAAYGAVHAFNAGFYAAEGEYVSNMNDDCIVIGDTLQRGVEYLDAHPRCGQVAFPWHDVGDENNRVMHVTLGLQQIDVIYANFGMTRRWLGDEVGWWGRRWDEKVGWYDEWEHYGGDCELSFNVLMAGYTVDELPGGEVLHFRAQDETRRVCYYNKEFMQKWMTLDVSQFMLAR